MKLFKNVLFLLVVACFFTACKKGGPSPDATAKSTCDCAAPLIEINEKMATTAPDEKEALITEYQKVYKEATSCMEAVTNGVEKELTGDALAKFETAYEAALKTACPKLAAMLNPAG